MLEEHKHYWFGSKTTYQYKTSFDKKKISNFQFFENFYHNKNPDLDQLNTDPKHCINSAADPRSGAFLTPGSEMGKKSGSG